MKLNKFKRRDGGGSVSKTVPSPSYDSYADVKSGGRFVQSYNPTTALRTADITICKSLDETYRMKDNITEESVMKYFNEMLQDFTDDDDTLSVTGKHDRAQLKTSLQEKNNHSKKDDQEFYFKKDTSAATPKIYDISFTPSKKGKRVSKPKSTPKLESTPKRTSVPKPTDVKSQPAPKDRVLKPTPNRQPTQTTAHTMESSTSASTKSQLRSEIKNETSINKIPNDQGKKSEKRLDGRVNKHDAMHQTHEVKKVVSVKDNDSKHPKSKQQTDSMRNFKIPSDGSQSSSTLPPKHKFSINNSVSSHGNTSHSSGTASIRSFEISIHSTGGSHHETSRSRIVQTTNGSIGNRSNPAIKEVVSHSTKHKKEKRKSRGSTKEYKIEVFKSEPVPTT